MFIKQTFCESLSEATTAPPYKMDVGEILQIANNLVQLDMDVAQNQLTIAMNQGRTSRRRRWWIRPYLQRTLYGQYERLMTSLRWRIVLPSRTLCE